MRDTSEIDAVDLFDPDSYRAGPPHEAFARLRAEAPVAWHQREGQPGFWAVTGYREIEAALRDPTTFSSSGGIYIDMPEDPSGLSASVLSQLDPPAHSALRRVVSRAFTPKAMAPYEARLQAVVERIVDTALERGRFDAVTDLGAPLGVEVMAEVLGVPVADRPVLARWCAQLTFHGGPIDEDEMAGEIGALAELFPYLDALLAERVDDPRDDVLTLIAHGRVDGRPLDATQRGMYAFLLLVAGTDTTRNLTSGGIDALLDHPTAWRDVVAHPMLVPTAIEEMLRWVTPAMYFRRTVTHNTELSGTPLRAGDLVALYLISANRDERVFVDPNRFDVRRTPNDHLSFAAGPHFCLGAGLAREESRRLFTQLARRAPVLQRAGAAVRQRSNQVNALTSLPVSAEAR